MNTLEQTTQLAIELIKQQQATDYEFSVGKVQELLPQLGCQR